MRIKPQIGLKPVTLLGAVAGDQFVRYKGLRRFYEINDASGIRTDQTKRLRRALSLLDQIQTPQEANLPGLRLHALRGDLHGFWSIAVSGNWRIIFAMDGSNVKDVDLVDYR